LQGQMTREVKPFTLPSTNLTHLPIPFSKHQQSKNGFQGTRYSFISSQDFESSLA
jgi:hypothetical protein